ncbi:MAG: hypothetical protein NC308_04070 [Clostridium sp.]|nr:hypothetical protein [Bacteroides sp.]MCM1198043.1 hypothetical protein [Clostridium sp.]
MCSEKAFAWLLPSFAAAILAMASCGETRKLSVIRNGEVAAGLSIPSDEDYRKARDEIMTGIKVDSIDSHMDGEPLIMNAIKDEVTGEMVAVDVINASTVVARFRNVAERFGKIALEFDITVPGDMIESGWRLKLAPKMKMLGDSTWLEPVYITGKRYRDEQMRGYMRYQAFLNSIITDSIDFVKMNQLEIFIRRHFPDTYAMKNDSSFVPDPVAENVFGVSQREALEHYTRHGLWQRNEKRKGNRDKMFRKYVKDPLIGVGMRLDTVMAGEGGTMVYRYVQDVMARPGLRKIVISLHGSLYEYGKQIYEIPLPEDLTFYVSSLSTLADMSPRYVVKVMERTVYDNTHAFIDFAQGSSAIDTMLTGNAVELRRVRKCVEDAVYREELELDSLKVSASCSPEGGFHSNAVLAASRAEAVRLYLGKFLSEETASLVYSGAIPENWEQFARLAASDTVISDICRKKVLYAASLSDGNDLDRIEREISLLPEYRYLREKIYPRLRTVRFDFYLHRKGMMKDTVHTTEIDSAYLAGVQAIKEMDYRSAVELLRPYHDYNTALAYLSAGYNHSALNDLESIVPATAAVEYMKAIVLSRLGRRREAMESYLRSVEKDPSMVHRANLDPELSEFTRVLNLPDSVDGP